MAWWFLFDGMMVFVVYFLSFSDRFAQSSLTFSIDEKVNKKSRQKKCFSSPCKILRIPAKAGKASIAEF
ncbi:MAG: hypothetical protein C0594_14745 [Marinilabiliales bacterium]|nr:MAG: hypothetical protein C0594_14745 [Marinilabiliales bacterium]